MALMAAILPGRALAWDEVTHGHISEMAIEEVHDPELRRFLTIHRDEVLSGTWFPDWGHHIKPHGEATHSLYLDAAFDDLQDPAVRAEPEHDRLVAHYLGVYAHVVEDRVLDATLKKHAPEVGEAHRDDLENGLLGIAGQGWLRQDFKLYEPTQDLARIYRKAGYFGDPRLNAETLAPIMRRSVTAGFTLNRELKFLSLLTVGEMRRVYPWGAANLMDAPGGYRSEARAVAAGWTALWAQLHGRPAPFLVYALPGDGGSLPTADAASPWGRITVVARHRLNVPALTRAQVSLTDSHGAAVPVSIFPYIDEPGHDIDLAFQIRADAPWRPGETYRLVITPGAEVPARAGASPPMILSFRAPAEPLFTGRAAPPRPWAMGMFLFVLAGSAGGMIWGAPDLLRLALPVGARPFWLRALNLALKVAGLALGLLALQLLWTNGAALVDWLHFHH
jgi:hypothetical protein